MSKDKLRVLQHILLLVNFVIQQRVKFYVQPSLSLYYVTNN